MKKIPAAKPFFSSSMPRSFIIEEMPGSSESETLVRSMYEIVYMMSATGMMRSQRSSFISGGIRAFVAKAQLRCRYNCAADQLLRHRPLHDRFNQFRGALVATVEIFAGGVRDAVRAPGFALRRDEHFTHGRSITSLSSVARSIQSIPRRARGNCRDLRGRRTRRRSRSRFRAAARRAFHARQINYFVIVRCTIDSINTAARSWQL